MKNTSILHPEICPGRAAKKSQALYALDRFGEHANLIEEAFKKLQNHAGHVRMELVKHLARCLAHLGMGAEMDLLRETYDNKLGNSF
jgi:hypothetical protein